MEQKAGEKRFFAIFKIQLAKNKKFCKFKADFYEFLQVSKKILQKSARKNFFIFLNYKEK